MRTIWKYHLSFGSGNLELPVDAKPLHLDFQGADLCLWVELDPDNMNRRYMSYMVLGTEHTFPEELLDHVKYFKSCIDWSKTLVLHVYIQKDWLS